jgi:hypothetical protein
MLLNTDTACFQFDIACSPVERTSVSSKFHIGMPWCQSKSQRAWHRSCWDQYGPGWVRDDTEPVFSAASTYCSAYVLHLQSAQNQTTAGSRVHPSVRKIQFCTLDGYSLRIIWGFHGATETMTSYSILVKARRRFRKTWSLQDVTFNKTVILVRSLHFIL